MGMSATGRKYGVTLQSISKWLYNYNLPHKYKDLKKLYIDTVL